MRTYLHDPVLRNDASEPFQFDMPFVLLPLFTLSHICPCGTMVDRHPVCIYRTTAMASSSVARRASISILFARLLPWFDRLRALLLIVHLSRVSSSSLSPPPPPPLSLLSLPSFTNRHVLFCPTLLSLSCVAPFDFLIDYFPHFDGMVDSLRYRTCRMALRR